MRDGGVLWGGDGWGDLFFGVAWGGEGLGGGVCVAVCVLGDFEDPLFLRRGGAVGVGGGGGRRLGDGDEDGRDDEHARVHVQEHGCVAEGASFGRGEGEVRHCLTAGFGTAMQVD